MTDSTNKVGERLLALEQKIESVHQLGESEIRNIRQQLKGHADASKGLISHHARIESLEKAKDQAAVKPYHMVSAVVTLLVVGAGALWGAIDLATGPLHHRIETLESSIRDHIDKTGHPALLADVENLKSELKGKESKGAADKALVPVQAQIADLVYHERSLTGHEAVVRLEEKHRAIYDAFIANQGKFEDGATTDAEQSGKIERALLLIAEAKERIEDVESTATHNERVIGQMAGATAANFVEIESQLRGENAVRNVHESWQTALIQLIANNPQIKIEDLEIFLSERIPAGATTTPGRVDINGG